jgi:tungstate transport system substrate-binding protein
VKKIVALLVGAALTAAACSADSERVVVAAGTTIVDSGFIEALIDEYPGGGSISIVAASSREGFALADGGAADMLFTHLAEIEDGYVAAHPEVWQEPVFESRFLVVGPPGQSVIRSGADVVAGFSAVAAAEVPFVSRSDGSGTAARERAIWDLALVNPTGEPWYIETGQGMGFTLQVTDQRDAFTLVEGGSFFAEASVLSLEEVAVTASPDGLLSNPYRMTLIDPSTTKTGSDLFTWMTSNEGREAMLGVNEQLYGRVVYAPSF